MTITLAGLTAGAFLMGIAAGLLLAVAFCTAARRGDRMAREIERTDRT